MNPLTVRQIRTIFAGELIQGSDDFIIYHGAYRLKQVKKQHTMLFLNKNMTNWECLKPYFPIVIVTEKNVRKQEYVEQITIIKVQNTDEAFWKFVHYYRCLFQIPVITVTGTSGKTTTKEMIKHILSIDKNVIATKSTGNSRTANFQYLLSIDDDTEAAVFETAVGAPGDILRAGKYFRPTIGIITNIGVHHLNYCKSPEEYIQEKTNMAKIIDSTGVLIINSEDKNSQTTEFNDFEGRIIKVGKDSSCHYRAESIQYIPEGMRFTLVFQNKSQPIFVPGLGEHQIYNALAAIAAAHEIGIHPFVAAERLKSYKNFNRQLQVFHGLNGAMIIDDTWSMTSTSLEAALNVLMAIGEGMKKIAIIGGMTDLGPWEHIIHDQAGEMISQYEMDVLITIGERARRMADIVLKNGRTVEVHPFNNTILVYHLLRKITDENTIILVKGDMYLTPIIDLAKKLRE